MNAQSPDRTAGSRALQVFSVVASIGILVMMLHVLANVATRYLFNAPVAGTLEMVSYWYMPVVTFLGFVLAKQADEHIEAPLIFDRLTWGDRRVLTVACGVVAAALCAAFAWFAFTGEALHGLERRTTGGVSTIEIWPVFFLPPVVFLILAVMYGSAVVRAARGQIDEPSSPGSALEAADSDRHDAEAQR